MGTTKRNRGLASLVAATLGVFALSSVAAADVTTERSGSIIVLPKVVWTGIQPGPFGPTGRDTIISISNTSNTMVHALCFYVNAAPVNPIDADGNCLSASPGNPALWNEIDFEIWLTKQQPTHWVASSGRRVNFLDGFGTNGAGLDPGLIPPVPLCFQGELKCVQVDQAGAPLRANQLKGEATLRGPDGDAAKYNAISILGNPDPGVQTGDLNELVLNNTPSNPGEYNACPDTLILNHFAYGAPDPVLAQLDPESCDPAVNPTANCPINTMLTLVPCSQDLESQIPSQVTVQFQIFNEFEQPFSTSITVDCWLTAPLNVLGTTGTGNPFTFNVLGTLGAHTRITPVPGHGGVLAVAEEVRMQTNAFGICIGGGAPGTQCTTDAGCAGGICRKLATGGVCAGAGAPIGQFCSDNLTCVPGFCRRVAQAYAAFNVHTEGNRFDAATDGKGNPVPGVTDQMVIPLHN